MLLAIEDNTMRFDILLFAKSSEEDFGYFQILPWLRVKETTKKHFKLVKEVLRKAWQGFSFVMS
jgi:uncharacterized ferritin-like protein (DUF455 family)